jgi:hypothetical protein
VSALRSRALPAIAAAALAVAAAGVSTSGAHTTASGHGHDHVGTRTALNARQLAFHDAMRKLWEDHVTWTRLAIVSFAAGAPDLQATEDRLLQNQADIGDAIKPYYGTQAGNRLTALLRDHILGAVALLQAAKAGDAAKVQTASAAWYANGNDVADFLSAANPRSWPRSATRPMMKEHLDETLKEAQDRLGGRFAADVADYEAIHRHILDMADTLSAGIMRQFPQRFR